MEDIKIIIERGIIRAVLDHNGNPYPATVHDYDVEGCEEHELHEDDEGDFYDKYYV